MVRPRKFRRGKDPTAYVNVGIHPEIHSRLSHEAVDSGRSLRELVHEALCSALGMDHLIPQDEGAHAASS